MVRSSSVSLEEKMDELELGGKMRKTHDMRSEMNLAQQQLVGFGMLPDQVRPVIRIRGVNGTLRSKIDWDMQK